MHRKIKADEVRIGMFIHAFEGPWMVNPFWRTRLLLTEQAQLDKLAASDVEFVIVDEERSDYSVLPVQPAAPTVRERRPPPTRSAATHLARPAAGHNPRQRALQPLTARERAAEVRRASSTIKRSKAAVMSMFDDARLGKAIKTKKMASLVAQISASVELDPAIILNIAKLKNKDEYTYLHSVAVCALMINLARTMRMDESQIHDIGMAGLVHDIGKMAIPDSILQKPGKLDDAEFQTVRSHPESGHKILSVSKGVSETALDVCLHHHEKMDGTGYPKRLKGNELSLVARMAAICDVYDAVTSQRSYNTPWTPSRALAVMQGSEGHFDQLVFKSFVESLGIYPMGTLLRLHSDQLAIVTGESAADFTLPTARIFYSIAQGCEWPVSDIEISRVAGGHAIAAIEDPAEWGFDDWPSHSLRLLQGIQTNWCPGEDSNLHGLAATGT